LGTTPKKCNCVKASINGKGRNEKVGEGRWTKQTVTKERILGGDNIAATNENRDKRGRVAAGWEETREKGGWPENEGG